MKTVLLAACLLLIAPASAAGLVFELPVGHTVQDSELPSNATTREFTFHGQRFLEVQGDRAGLVMLYLSNGTNNQITYGYLDGTTDLAPVLNAVSVARSGVIAAMPALYNDEVLQTKVGLLQTGLNAIPTDTATKEDVQMSVTVKSPMGPFILNIIVLVGLVVLVLFDVRMPRFAAREPAPSRAAFRIQEIQVDE